MQQQSGQSTSLSPLFSFSPQAAALVHIYLDGSALVSHGGIEMGQGVHTKMIQVRIQTLGSAGCVLTDIRVHEKRP